MLCFQTDSEIFLIRFAALSSDCAVVGLIDEAIHAVVIVRRRVSEPAVGVQRKRAMCRPGYKQRGQHIAIVCTRDD